MKDIFGTALLDYLHGNYTEDLMTSTSISDEDELPLPYLFRSYEEMPPVEQEALKRAYGKVLDVGCGAGSHSLHLQNSGLEVKAIDVSPGAIEVTKARGISLAEVKDVLQEKGKYDTILLMMNGTGIFQELAKTPDYLRHLKSLLLPGGQILIDSTDIKYMYEDEDGGMWEDLNAVYYGELDYLISYKGVDEEPMTWLYLDFDTLAQAAAQAGLQSALVMKGEQSDYLARLF